MTFWTFKKGLGPEKKLAHYQTGRNWCFCFELCYFVLSEEQLLNWLQFSWVPGIRKIVLNCLVVLYFRRRQIFHAGENFQVPDLLIYQGNAFQKRHQLRRKGPALILETLESTQRRFCLWHNYPRHSIGSILLKNVYSKIF